MVQLAMIAAVKSAAVSLKDLRLVSPSGECTSLNTATEALESTYSPLK